MPANTRKTRATAEFGDFQTPPSLALAVTRLLARRGIRPRSIVEPTCGRGAFISAAAATFPEVEELIGLDINTEHLNEAAADSTIERRNVSLRQGNFFTANWKGVVTKAKGPWLVLGNPPWVTSSALGILASDNLPEKSNFQGHAGMDAITGKSNFDISEWMILQYLDWLRDSTGTVAVLCKTAVARKILLHIWKVGVPLKAAQIYKIDALAQFNAAVDACLFLLEVSPGPTTFTCSVFASLESEYMSHSLGFVNGRVLSDMATFTKHRNLCGADAHYLWRSGIKHDCSKVMELSRTPDGYRNGLGEIFSLEDIYLFPMLKSSDIGNGRTKSRRVMLVPQHSVGQETRSIIAHAPKTWSYLEAHAADLDRRGSVVYKGKPQFSIFGVGPYAFAPWKVAISGFYKKLSFLKIGPENGRPVVFDDTVYFLSCESEEEATFLESLLKSKPALAFLASMIHWVDKRPITVDLLKRLDLRELSRCLDRESEYTSFTNRGGQLELAAASGTLR